jgi:hypothetical protein
MPLPSYVVELQFGSSSYVDVTSYVKSVSINKGISRQLDDYSAGTLSISFVNNDRTFDPLNTSSILWYATGSYTIVQPGGKIRVTASGVRRFTGFVQTWDFSYDEAGFDGQAQLTALDEMFQLSNAVFTGGTQAVIEGTSDRIKRTMKTYGFTSADYAGVTGGQTLLGLDENNAGDNVLSYLQNVARSEPGDFFANSSAVMVFKDRSFANYVWNNTDRQNLVKYPGTATVQTDGQNGWVYGYQPDATAVSIYGGPVNKSQIVALDLQDEMVYEEIDLNKYNPDGTATQYVFSGFFKGVTGNVALEVDFYVLNARGQVVASSINTTTANATAWTQLSATATVSSGTAAGVLFTVFSAGTTSSFDFFGNALQVERGSAWVNYFDGGYNPYTSDASNVYQVAWAGTAYQSASGMLISQASAIAAPTILTFADQNSQGASYGNGTGIPFTDLAVAYGGEQLYNQVQVVGVNATAVVSDSVGQTNYGLRAFSQTDNLTTSVTAPAKIAAGLLGEFRLPEYRASAITVALEALTAGQQTSVLGLEIRDVVRVCFQPSATGSVVDKYYQILAINSNTDVERDHITLTVASLDNLPIRLDSTLLSILDTDTLA